MAQDYYDPLQPFAHIVNMLDDAKATLGLRYIAKHDEELFPQYPAVLMQIDNTERTQHATRQFMLRFHFDLWVFHAEMTVDKATRSEMDIALATNIRKLLHTDKTLGGHIIFGWVDGEFPGMTRRAIGDKVSVVVCTRLTWQGENRVPFDAA